MSHLTQTAPAAVTPPACLMLAGVTLTVGFDLSRAQTRLETRVVETLLRAGVDFTYHRPGYPMAGYWIGGRIHIRAWLPLPSLGVVEVYVTPRDNVAQATDLVIGRDLHAALMAAALAPQPIPNPPAKEIACMDTHLPVVNDTLPIARIEGEARILDTDLAARLGFAQVRDIRKLIKRYQEELDKLGPRATVARVVNGGNAVEHYLNRKQAIFITAKSETPTATDITIEIIERFDAYERGAHQPQATAAAPASEPLSLAERRVRVMEMNAANRAVDFIIKTSGRREASRHLPAIYAKAGLHLDLPSTPPQGEFDTASKSDAGVDHG